MKKLFCLLLAALLLLTLMAGCSQDSESPGPGSATPTPKSPSEGTQTEEPPTGGFEPNPPIEWGDYEVTDVGQEVLPFDKVVAMTKDLPLAGEKVTFTAWWPMRASTNYTNYNEVDNMIELENRTNIHIEYYHPSATEVATSFPLMIASGDYHDMIYYAGYYSGGGDRAIEDGVYIRLNELIDKHAPNYNAIRNYTDEARKMTITSSGNIWGFYQICMENMPGYMGLNIRQDFLDRIGYEGRPVTIDDWDDMLGQLLNGIDELEYALAIPPTGVTRWSAFVSAWGVGSDWYQVDGVVKYGPLEEGFRNYVELMKSWYDKGYLGKDFYGVNPQNYNNDITWMDYGAGKFGACDGSNTFGNMLTNWGAPEDSNGIAARQPVLNVGDETHIRFDQGVINGEQLAITTACENPDLLVQWIDYRYTFEGYLLIYYGIEGQTYKMTGPNYIQMTELLYEDPAVQGFSALGKYVASILEVSVSDYTNGWCFLDPRYAVEIKVWGQDKCDHNYPNIDLLTADDGAEFARIYSDIETFVYETVPKFIIGSISMDKYEEVFVNKIKSLDIDRAIELKQAALNDFNSR
jgi:putative aldouronate transport system substrate-binding protein